MYTTVLAYSASAVRVLEYCVVQLCWWILAWNMILTGNRSVKKNICATDIQERRFLGHTYANLFKMCQRVCKSFSKWWFKQFWWLGDHCGSFDLAIGINVGQWTGVLTGWSMDWSVGQWRLVSGCGSVVESCIKMLLFPRLCEILWNVQGMPANMILIASTLLISCFK